MVSSGLLRREALVRTDVSEEPGASFIRVTKIGELGTAQAATSNRRTLRRNFFAAYVGCMLRLLVTPTSPILVTLMMEAILSFETSVLKKLHDVKSQKTTFFIVTVVKTSNLT
jgi:hypothetical protein